MTTSIDSPDIGARPRKRQIGPIGSAGRLLLGVAFLVGAFVMGVAWLDVFIGLVASNAIVIAVLWLRGRDAAPLRAIGVGGHLANFAIGIPFVSLLPVPGLLFFGSAMLLAAARGFGACEMLAVSNLVRGRDDQLGCPIFSPIDFAEEKLTGGPGEC